MQIEAEKIEIAYREAKSLLNERERDILMRFYGLEKSVRHSLEEIARIYNVTRERIRQIKAVALKKIGIKQKSKRRKK